MAKLGLLFPFQEMLDTAKPIIEAEKINVAYMKVTCVSDVVDEARRAINAGADILIARGYQAKLLHQYIKVPLIEMRIHSQEIGLLLKKAKSIVDKERPHIGIVCYDNMLEDMSEMGELFDVDLTVTLIENLDQVSQAIADLKAKGVDLIIGGNSVCREASMLGIPGLLYGSSVESVREAFRVAARMARIIETEKEGRAQFESVLSATFNGIIKINSEGRITVINRLIENLIGMNMEDVLGKEIGDIFPEFDQDMISSILTGKSERHTISVNIRNHAWILNMSPIQYNDEVTGAIFSLQRISEAINTSSDAQRRMLMNGYSTDILFKNIHTENAAMRNQIEQAKTYALSDRPVLIYGETGTETYRFGAAIHNNSPRKNSPFVSMNLETLEEEEQIMELFGDPDRPARNSSQCLLERAQYGTLFLHGIEKAGPKTQLLLSRYLTDEGESRTEKHMVLASYVRIIASTRVSLQTMVENGTFNEALFYALQGLVLQIPPLRERKEDLLALFTQEFETDCKKYNKYLVLSDSGKNRICQLPWPGNRIQVKLFCERLVLCTDKRRVDEVSIQKLYDQLYPKLRITEGKPQVVIYRTPEAEEINALLEKYHGSRSLAAEELGISTTTLWRKMKKYGIEEKYRTK